MDAGQGVGEPRYTFATPYEDVHAPLPNLNAYQGSGSKREGAHPCAICCTIFSASGIVFLFGVANALKSDTMYLLMEGAEGAKSDYAESVFGGMYIYFATMLIALAFWVKGCMSSSSSSRSGNDYVKRESQMIRQHGTL